MDARNKLIIMGLMSLTAILFIGACGEKVEKKTSSLASFYENCRVTTIVQSISRIGRVNGTTTEADPRAIVIKVTASELVDGHTDCQDHIGKEYALLTDGTAFGVGQEVKFNFSNSNGLTADGEAESFTWQIIQ